MLVVADLKAKVVQYEAMLRTALDHAAVVEGEKYSKDFVTMARSYYEDGTHFQKAADLVNALVCYSYGHGWLDAGIRIGALTTE